MAVYLSKEFADLQPVAVCVDESVSVVRLIRAFVAFGEANRGALVLYPASVPIFSLQKAFPCPK
jgi:hypothetical protein